MARLSMVEAINRTFHELMEKDDRIVVMGEDVGVDGGVFRATVGLLEKFGENRVIDTPLAESCIVGAAMEWQYMGCARLLKSNLKALCSRHTITFTVMFRVCAIAPRVDMEYLW